MADIASAVIDGYGLNALNVAAGEAPFGQQNVHGHGAILHLERNCEFVAILLDRFDLLLRDRGAQKLELDLAVAGSPALFRLSRFGVTRGLRRKDAERFVQLSGPRGTLPR